MKFVINKLLNKLGYKFLIIKNNEIGSISLKLVNVSKETESLKIIEKNNPFKNKKLKILYSNKGYFYLDPPLSEIQLKKYYENYYWKNFRNTDFVGVKKRDLFHFELMKKYNLLEKNSVLNFGSGHGGVSYLLSLLRKDVTNFEYDLTLNYLEENFKTTNSLKDIKDNSIEIIYSSHSLEHVSNIESTMSELKRIATNKCAFFIEVPNAEYHKNGAQKNTIDEPHTYYFTIKYFEHIFNEILLIQTYSSNDLYDIKNFELSKSSISEDDSLIVIGFL